MSTATQARTTVELVHASTAGTVEIARDGATVLDYILGVNTPADFDELLSIARALGALGHYDLFEMYDDGSEGWTVHPA